MKPKKIIVTMVITMAIFLGILQLTAPDGIDVKQAQILNQQGALLLDVREPAEYSAVHAPNAKLIPLGQINSRLNELDSYKDKPIVVICRSGRRSAQAVSMLQNAGYTRVSNVKGGILAWESSGLEVIKM